MVRLLAGLATAGALLSGCAGSGVAPARIEDLVGIRWHWFASVADGSVAPVPEPARHWFETGAGGAIIVQADCNSGVGRRANIDGMRFGPIGLTRRFCGERSRDAAFAAALSGVTDAATDAGLLRLTSGPATLLFTRAADARLLRLQCAGRQVDVLWSEEMAWLVTPGGSRPLERMEPRTATRYADAETAIERDAEALVLTDRRSATRSRCAPAQ